MVEYPASLVNSNFQAGVYFNDTNPLEYVFDSANFRFTRV